MGMTGKELLEKYKKRRQENDVSSDETTSKPSTSKPSTGSQITGSQLLDKYYGRTSEVTEETKFTFSENGKKGWQKYLDDKEASRQQAIAEEEEKSWWEKFLENYLESQRKTPTDNPIVNSFSSMVDHYREDVSYMRPADDWKDEQRDAFGSLYLESPAKAYAYAEETNKKNNAAKEEAAIGKIQDSATGDFWSGAGHTVGAIAAAPFGLSDFLDDLAKTAAGREIMSDGFVSPFEYSQAVTGGISEDLNETYGVIDESVPIIGGKGWGDVYGLGTSIAQSAVSGLTLGSAGTLVSYFGQGAASGVDEALKRGATEGQALLYGTALGTFEGVAEMIGIDNLFKIGSSATVKEAIKNVLRQAGAEGLEEGLTSILSNIADNAIMQGESNFNLLVEQLMAQGMSEDEAKKKAWLSTVGDIAFDALGGFVSGGVHAGFGTGIQTSVVNAQNKKYFGDQAQDMVNEALASENAEVKAVGEKYQQKLDKGKNLSGWNISELLETTDVQKVKSAVAARLTELGETGDVSAIADALTKQAQGYDLTIKEKKLLQESSKGHLVATEMDADNIKGGGLENKWAESIGTRRLNADVYNKELYDLAEKMSGLREEAEKESVAKSEADIENEAGVKFEASEDGKTVYIDAKGNARDATVKRIASTEGGLKVELEGGITVNASDLSFGTKEEALVYEMVARMETTAETANEILKAIKPSNIQQATRYFATIPLAYQYGKMGYESGLKNVALPDNLRKIAYNRGRMDAIAQDKSKTKPVAKKGNTKASTKKGGIIFENGYVYDASKANDLQKASMAGIEVIDKMSNLEVHVFESKVVDGKRVSYVNGKLTSAPNGYYVDGNKIYIDINAGNGGEGAMLYTMGHEVAHYIREWNAKGFRELGDFLIKEYGKKGVPVNALLEAQKDKIKRRYAEEKKALPSEARLNDMAYEELVADAMSDMFTDEKAYEKLAKLKQKNRSLWQKLGEAIKALLDKLKTALGVYKTQDAPVAQEAYFVRGFSKEAYDKLQDLYIKAFVEADANYAAASVSKAAKTEGTGEAKYSYSSIAYSFFGDDNISIEDMENGSYKKTEGYKQYVDQCLNNMRQSVEGFNEKAALKEIRDSIDGIVKVAVAMKKAGYDILDSEGGRNIRDSKKRLLFSSLEPNSDYFTSSDISTICDKRINFAEIYDEIVRREDAMGVPKSKRFFNNIDNYFVLHKILADKGLTAPCRQCYVESMRKNLDPMANAFIELMQEKNPDNKANKQLYQPSGKNKGELKSNNAKLRENLLEVIEREQYDITADDLTIKMLTTADGLAQLKLQAPLIYEAFNSFYGQSKPKMPKQATPFRFGELTALLTDDKGRIKKGLIDKIMSTGGFRLQSYSDFQIQNFADVLQVIFEAGTLGLNGHAYTKVPAFLDATKGTNLKRNISIFMYKDGGQWKIDRGDSFPYELEKIYDIVDADKSGNTGIIAVVQNEDMAAWIMANDNVGYFIPFHKSGVKMGVVRETIVREGGREIKGYSGIKDHTRQQTEVWAKTTADHKANTKVKKGINIYEFWDFENADNLSQKELIEKNVKAYIDACNEAGYLPKFREYVMGNGKVLNRVLAYAKELGFVSQNATIDDISFEYSGYRIPYGYYKCLGDFGMFTPDGEASPIERLSLKDYNFNEAVKFFSDAETLRRNEILQQFENGFEREKYRNSNMTTAELAEEVQKRRKQIVDEVVSGEYKKAKYSDRDSSYLDAVNRGDMETAQRMVDEAAKKAGYTIKGSHGTLSYFTIFDRSFGNAEGDWGKGFYFTNNEDDVETNYASADGADLQVKIEKYAEQLGWTEEYGDLDFDELIEVARKELIKGDPRVIKAYLKMDNPVIVGGQNETYFDFTEEYDEETDEYGEPTGKLVEFVEALTSVLEEYTANGAIDADRVNVYELFEDGDGYTASQLEKAAADLLENVMDENGDYASKEIIRAAFEEIGFDGIVDNTVAGKFGDRSGRRNAMVGVTLDTTHYIAFKSSQIKQSDPVVRDDNGNVIPLSERFNPKNSDIRYSDRENIGYHAGDLGKSEWLHMQGYSRGTGHFGTGTYFVGDEAKISGESTYGKRPHHAVDFSDYNLYKVKDNSDGYKLHEQLRVIDGGISQEWFDAAKKDQFSLVSMVDVYDLAEERFGEDKYSQEATESAIHELAEKHGIELLSREEYSEQNDIPLDDEDFLFYYVDDYLRNTFKKEAEKLDSQYGEFRDAYFWLKLRFGYKATEQALQKVVDYQNANADTRWHTDKKDSLATVFMKALGYEGIDVRGTGLDNTTFGSVIYDLKEDTVLYQDRDSYAPTFYSHMGKVIDDIKLEKMGTSSILNHLKNRGVKDEEIKWSGIEAFLEGKKSVTKAELVEFVAGSQLQIEEKLGEGGLSVTLERSSYGDDSWDVMRGGEILDTYSWSEDSELYESDMTGGGFATRDRILAHFKEKYGSGDTRWGEYKLDGGSNYRELVFKMPNSSYSNQAMRTHWGQDAEGVLAHARIQDFEVDGKKMLFVEEIQSDWHNAGQKYGYEDKRTEWSIRHETRNSPILGEDRYVRLYKNGIPTETFFPAESFEIEDDDGNVIGLKSDKEILAEIRKHSATGETPDAPFRNNYHEYVLKRLLRMAAEEGYDSIGWTTADIQSQRWSDEYAEGYRIEYDQDIPKFLRKYGKKWGATVGKVRLPSLIATVVYYDVNRMEEYETLGEWRDAVANTLKEQGVDIKNVRFDFDSSDTHITAYDRTTGMVYDKAEKRTIGDKVWSMDITDSMTESVLYEGQVLYSERVTDKETLDFLENQEHITTYKSFVEIDGKLYSPMATKVKGKDGKYRLTNPSEIGVWQQAEEKPESIPKFNKSGYGYYVLKKDDGSTITAAYNPYEHSSNLVLNDQFEGAYQRPNLVTVECVIPKSEMTSGYKAKYAKDSVGYLDWKSGTVAGKLKDNKRKVYLSRWLKPVRILSNAEVAAMYKDILGTSVSVPFNVVPPQLLTELEKAGVKIDYEGSPAYQYRQSKKATNGSTKLSDRDTTSVSNRSLLAGALETAAKNQSEREMLAVYRAQIGDLNKAEVRIREIREDIKELSKTKGNEETIKALRQEMTYHIDEVNRADKRLLQLESTKALKGVLEREKAALQKRLEEKSKKALSEQRQKDAKTVRELMNRYHESRSKAVEGRHKTEMRHKIKKVVSDLNKLLLNPTKEKHVPIGLQLPVAEALDAINMDSMNAEERVAYYNDLISKSSDPDEIKMLTKKRDFFEYRDATFKERIAALKNAYAEFKESDDPLIRNAHNDAIEDLIKNTADAVGNKSLKDMSLAQLEAVYNMYKAILATVRNANKMFKEGRQETVTENSEKVKVQVKDVGGHQDRVLKLSKFFKKFGWDMLKPVTAMKVIGSKTFEKLFDNVRAGEDTWAVDVSEAKEFYEGVAKKYDFKKWDFKKRYSFKDSRGEDFSISLEQIMSLYAYSKRDQADKHLEFGGFIFDDAIEVTEKKMGIPLKYEVNDANPHRLRKDDVLAITDTLTTEQKAFIDEMQAYLSDVMGAKGNEVSLAMYDIKLYNEKNYFPLKTSRYFREFDPEKSGTPRIKNSGFSKKTIPQAGNPIVLSNFMDVWAGHVNDMSMYHAFVLPLEDFMRVYNYSSTAGGYDSVQQYIKNAYGSQANQYIERLMDDLNGGARVDSSAGVINKGLSLFKKASVFASASVVVQQPSAIARAFAYINPKYFVTSAPSAMNPAKHKKLWAEVKKYAPVAVIKEMGYFDTGMGRSTVEWIKGDQTIKDKMDDALSKAPAMADELVWCHLWEAVKRETKATKKLKAGSEDFYEECGRRFTEVITNTQVYDSVLSRSGMMRSKDTGMKMATAFMAEPTTTVNMMVDGIIQGKRGNKKFTAATVGAVSSSIILNSILVALVYAARDDDEDETYAEKYIGSVTSELLDGFNPLTYVPFVKDIWSIAQGYDVERSDMSVVSKLWESVEGLFKEDKSGWEKVLDVSGSVSSLFGIPLKNIIRDAKGMYNLTLTLTSGTQTTGAGISESVEDSFKSSIPLWDRLTESKSNADRLYEAILSGDRVQIERIKNRYKDEKAMESAMRQALRDNDPRIKEAAQARYEGDISEYTRIATMIIAEGRFKQDDVVAAINAELNAIKRGEVTEVVETEDEDEVTSIYSSSDINAAFDNGDTNLALEIINDLIETKMANGMEEKNARSSIKSSITSYWKPLYKQAYEMGDSAEMYRIRTILLASGLYGSANDVVKTVWNWLKS